MVHFKIILRIFVLLAILNSCNNKNIDKELDLKLENRVKFTKYEKQFCFKKIYQLSNKIPSEDTNYYKLDTAKAYQYLEKQEGGLMVNKLRDFDSYTDDSNLYLLKNNDESILISIGKATGASALGADYWNYLCYSLSQKKEIKFGSLINSPYSVFSANKKINYIEVIDNIPRPANGEEIKLTYTPLVINVYDLEKKLISNLEMNCE